MSKLAKIWNIGYLAMSCSIRTIRVLEITPDLINWEIGHNLGQIFLLKHTSNL